MTLRDKLDKILVVSCVVALAWLLRLFMLEVVSDHWIGTVGITAGLFGGLTYLSYAGRLGAWGRVYRGIILSKASRKATKIMVSLTVTALFFLGSFSAGMHASSMYYSEQTAELSRIAEQNGQPMTREELESQISADLRDDPLRMALLVVVGFVAIPLLMFADFPLFASMTGTMNGIFGGQLVHIVDIFLIQEIEAIIILVLVRRLQARIP